MAVSWNNKKVSQCNAILSQTNGLVPQHNKKGSQIYDLVSLDNDEKIS